MSADIEFVVFIFLRIEESIDAEHYPVLVFVKLDNLERQQVTFGECILRSVDLFAQLGNGHKTLDIVWELHRNAAVVHTDYSTLGLATDGISSGEVWPWVPLELLKPETDAPVVRIDVQDDEFDLVPFMCKLGWMHDALRPRHIRYMDQPVDSLLDFDKSAEAGEVSNDSLDLCAGWILCGKYRPWIRFELFDSERDFLILFIDGKNDHVDLVVESEHLRWVVDVFRPRHF